MMTRFLGWYVAAILAAYALSASWSLGAAGAQLTATEARAEQLSVELDVANEHVISLEQQTYCDDTPEACSPEYPP